MLLTIQTLFNDPNVVQATIDRVLQQGLDRIYWQQYLTFRRTTQRVFKDYLGTVTGVVAGSINSRYGEKPIRERKSLGSGYGEIAYLGDAYQIDVERLSELQDLIDKYNEAKPTDQIAAMNEIIQFITDDYRQIILAPHKRMDIVVGSLLMTGKATVKNKDNKEGIELLDIDLPFNFITPKSGDIVVDGKKKFISYMQSLVLQLRAKYGVFGKMVMSRATFNKFIVGSSEFSDTFKMVMPSRQFDLATGLMTTEMANSIMSGIGLPAIDIKEDYVEEQDGTNVQIYADNRITLLRQDMSGYMRHHTPYEATDPVTGRQYNAVGENNGQMLISNYRDKNGRYMEYTAEWIPQFTAPNKIVNINLEGLTL